LSNNLLLRDCPLKHLGATYPFNNLKELGLTQTATAIFIDYGLLMIDYWVVGSENDEVIAAHTGWPVCQMERNGVIAN
jgi:hypothetical protein